MKPVVLVTAIGTAASTTIVSVLKGTNAFYIIGSDIYHKNQIATTKDVDEFYVFPPVTGEQVTYIDFVIQFCLQHKVLFYFPTIDEEVVKLAANRDRFNEVGVKLCIPNNELIEICHNKNYFFEWIKKNIPRVFIPVYQTIESINEKDFPVFIKPVKGRGSNGCKKIESKFQLIQLLTEGMKIKDYIVQPFIDGDVISVDLVRNANTGQKAQIQRIEELRNLSGCGIAVQIIYDEELTAICNELMEKLNLNGVANAEFFRLKDGYRIIEVNPRFPAGTSFSVMSGLNTPLNAIRIACGDECDFETIAYGQHLAKRYETYVLD